MLKVYCNICKRTWQSTDFQEGKYKLSSYNTIHTGLKIAYWVNWAVYFQHVHFSTSVIYLTRNKKGSPGR